MTADLTGNRTTSILKALFFCLAFTGLLACLSPLKHLLPLRFERLAYGIIGTIAALFALYHVAGGQSWFSACLGPGVWSFVFGLAMIMSRGIALPTGLHLGVNFILAAIGQHTGFASLWNIQYKPPNLFVGTTILNLLANRFIGLGQVEPKNR